MGRHPGEITNVQLLNLEEYVICEKRKEIIGYLDMNLKDNLKEGEDFIIVDEEIWNYLKNIYGGQTIKRMMGQSEKEEE